VSPSVGVHARGVRDLEFRLNDIVADEGLRLDDVDRAYIAQTRVWRRRPPSAVMNARLGWPCLCGSRRAFEYCHLPWFYRTH